MNGFSLARVMAVLTKEFVQLRRDRITYAMILVIPVVQLLLFGYAINSDPRHLPTAVLAQDGSAFARSTIAAIANSGYLDIVEEATSPAELDDALAKGRVQFTLTIPADFTTDDWELLQTMFTAFVKRWKALETTDKDKGPAT